MNIQDLYEIEPSRFGPIAMKRSADEDECNDSGVRKALRSVLQSKKQNGGKEEIESKKTPVICSLKDVSMPSPGSSNESSSESQSSSSDDIKRRRERNRLAAQKCRQNRKNRVDELELQCKTIVQESENLQKDIESLRRQKKELETLLETHSCVMDIVKT